MSGRNRMQPYGRRRLRETVGAPTSTLALALNLILAIPLALAGDAALPDQVEDKAATEASAMAATLSREPIDDGNAVRLFHTRGELLDVEAVYPVLPGDEPSIATANAAIAAAYTEMAQGFLAQYEELLADNDGEHLGNPWSFSLGYEGVLVTARLVAVDGGGYMYTGGAHGGALYLPLVLDRRSGERLEPSDLFRPDSDRLAILARHSRSALADLEPFRSEPELLTDDWLEEGTAPTPEKYSLLLPTADGIRVTFSHYQIGPYAIGDFHITVPYGVLTDALNPALFPQQAQGD